MTDAQATAGGGRHASDAMAALDAARPEALIGLPESALPSPAFCVDLERLRRNCAMMQAKVARLGVGLRVHVKTHKTTEAARLQTSLVPPGEARICVSTLKEAAHFARAGFGDILLAIPVEASKMPRVAALHAAVPVFALLLDAPVQLEPLLAAHAAAVAAGDAAGARPYNVWLKVNAGYGRAGVDPRSPGAVALAQTIARGPATRLAGIYSHSGNSYNSASGAGVEAARAAVRAVAAAERDALVAFAGQCRAAGVEVPAVSAGATPSCCIADDWAGVTELHPGNYAFFDRQQVASGSCGREDIAVHVLARVLSQYVDRGEMLLDCGGTALHKDSGGLADWGELADYPRVVLRRISQEHGVAGAAAGAPPLSAYELAAPGLAVGAAVRVYPNHSCMTACGHEVFYVVDASRTVVDVWRPARGW